MFERFLFWLFTDGEILSVDTRWRLKLIAIKLKLYKPDLYELACIEHNKQIKKRKRN